MLIKILFYVFFVVAIALGQINKTKIKDEDRPYEFSFTIGNEQHRYEKKDVNGIIQGEFGFITADGVYHVTVYATDENGNFKILSMKNIKVSEPLDQIDRNQQQSGYQRVPSTTTQHSQQNSETAWVYQQTSPTVPQTRFSNSQATQKPISDFTTGSTIRQGCGGCGIITTPLNRINVFATGTTSKPYRDETKAQVSPKDDARRTHPPLLRRTNFTAEEKNNSPLKIQIAPISTTASHRSPKLLSVHSVSENETPNRIEASYSTPIPLSVSYGNPLIDVDLLQNVSPTQAATETAILDKSPKTVPQKVPENNLPDKYSNKIENYEIPEDSYSTPIPTSDSKFIDVSLQKAVNPTAILDTSSKTVVQNGFIKVPENDLPGKYPNRIESSPQTVGSYKIPEGSYSTPIPNNLKFSDVHLDTSSKAVVENGFIKVPGNDPIPIQDKYPNMLQGLPQGVTKNDVSDLLYKFNYTVGFHGHYEKGWRNGTKVGGYFVNGRDGYSRVVTYVADEFGYRPKFKLIRLGLDSLGTPKEETEKSFGLQYFEFVWYPLN